MKLMLLATLVATVATADFEDKKKAPKGASALVCAGDVSRLNYILLGQNPHAWFTRLTSSSLYHFYQPYTVSAPAKIDREVCVTVTQN